MTKRKMTRRLIVLFSVSALASGAVLILYHFVFSDILPLAAGAVPQSIWRFEAAFLVTAAAWICGAVCLLSALANPLTQKIGISEAKIVAYCECVAAGLAEAISMEELRYVASYGKQPASFSDKATVMGQFCSQETLPN